MRARLLHAWPALAHHFGLKPWDLDRLTPFELEVFLHAAADLNRPRG